MNNEVAVSVRSVNKAYLLYRRPQDRLKQSLFYKFGKNYARTFWALRDISFDVHRGETLGIIGRNGSGKSTLLQIIAGVLQPTAGVVQVHGRITALLELGAGFSPEFTGQENIFLSGSVLGISESEMQKRYDQIVDFAQIGDFLEQPVKFYSSGMYVRLAFSIAASVDPDVLIIDEALAVGDAGFVIKCMQRMKHLKESGTTIILVTHDIHAVRSFCDRVIWLQEGQIRNQGSTMDITSQYAQTLFEASLAKPEDVPELTTINAEKVLIETPVGWIATESLAGLIRWGSGEIRVEKFLIDNGQQADRNSFVHGEHLRVKLQLRTTGDVLTREIGVGISFRNMYGLDILTSTTLDEGLHISPPALNQSIQVSFDLENILSPGDYALVLNIEDRMSGAPKYYDFIENAAVFKVVADKPIYSLVLPKVTQQVTSVD